MWAHAFDLSSSRLCFLFHRLTLWRRIKLKAVNEQFGLTYRWPGLLQSDDAGLLESSSSSFDVTIEPVVVCASPPAGDRVVSVFGFSVWPCVVWPCAWWWGWCVLVLLPQPLLLPLIIVAVGHCNVFAVDCVSLMGSIWKSNTKRLSAWSDKINNVMTRKSRAKRINTHKTKRNENKESKKHKLREKVNSSQIIAIEIFETAAF